jgi:hypothetical protein
MNKNNWLFLIVALLALIGLFIFLKPKPTTTYQAFPNPTSESTQSAQMQNNVKSFDLVIKDKKLISGPETLQVSEGDQVVINITSDSDEELHLHGYDKSIDLQTNEPAKLEFVANLTGRFEYELENSKTDIGALEVQPK